jgi:hypothetical protein
LLREDEETFLAILKEIGVIVGGSETTEIQVRVKQALHGLAVTAKERTTERDAARAECKRLRNWRTELLIESAKESNQREDEAMLIEIKGRFDGKLLYSGEHDSIKLAVKAAVKLKVNLRGSDLSGIKGSICSSHELLAHVAVRFDVSLTPVAAMICGRMVGCWKEYTAAIRQHFGEDVMRRLWQAWSQDESWGVVAKMKEHGWPDPGAVAAVAAKGEGG